MKFPLKNVKIATLNNSAFFPRFRHQLLTAGKLILVAILFFHSLMTTTSVRYADHHPDLLTQDAPLDFAISDVGLMAPPAIKKNLKTHLVFILTEAATFNTIFDVEVTAFSSPLISFSEELYQDSSARAPPLS